MTTPKQKGLKKEAWATRHEFKKLTHKYHFHGNILVIEDSGEGRSVTNSIQLYFWHFGEHFESIIYRDSEQDWNAVLWDGTQPSFFHLGGASLDEAVEKWKKKLSK